LVTGGSGFLGRHVLPEALRRGHEVVALARGPAAERTVAALGAQPLPGDLDDPASVDLAFATAGADALINLASLGFGHAPAVVAAAEEAGIGRAVFVSTTAVTTTLNTPSRQMRLTAEQTIRASTLAWTILRPTMIYGAPGDRNVSRLLAVMRRAPLLPVPGGGARMQQPVHVKDLAGAVLAAVESAVAVGRTYDVAGPEPITFAELLRESARATGGRIRFLSVPLAPTIAFVRGYERVSRHPRIRAEQLQRLAEDKAFNIDAATRDLDFAPRSFRDGVAELARLL
jgi:uncharacterized protein YbjT (DUF2867 family)